MLKSRSYDFIFCGAGCASLSLLLRMLRSGRFTDKKILLIDKEPKIKNDRTWCFWEKENGFFENIVYRQWPVVGFYSDNFSGDMALAPYRYKMIRGIDFFQYCFDIINRHPQIEIVYAEAGPCRADHTGVSLVLNGQTFQLGPGIVFNSVYNQDQQDKTMRVLQHFKGRVIETSQPVFNPGQASLMDFRVSQEAGTTFAYVLPFSETKALVEYTLFTPQLLEPSRYDSALDHYIRHYLGVTQYKIQEEEFGVIPMTNEQFRFYKDGLFHIGTAGGQTKASSGYTFQFIQKQSAAILNLLLEGKPLTQLKSSPARFRFYDNTLLRILYYNSYPGNKIFSTLFRRNKVTQVLKFLDNESTIAEELRILSSLPVGPFLKSALKIK